MKLKNGKIKLNKMIESMKQIDMYMIFNNPIFSAKRSFGDSIYASKIRVDEAEMDQFNLLDNIVGFNNKPKPRSNKDKDKKLNTFNSASALYELTLNAFICGTFPVKTTKGKGLKISTSKQMLQRLPIALAQVKAGNTSENLLNEV